MYNQQMHTAAAATTGTGIVMDDSGRVPATFSAAAADDDDANVRALPAAKQGLTAWRMHWADIRDAATHDKHHHPSVDLDSIPSAVTERTCCHGNVNVRTVKECGFAGLNSCFVVAGSDCGCLYVWDSATGELLTVVKADSRILNTCQAHPTHPFLVATSGIDNDVRLVSHQAVCGDVCATTEFAADAADVVPGVPPRVGHVLTAAERDQAVHAAKQRLGSSRSANAVALASLMRLLREAQRLRSER